MTRDNRRANYAATFVAFAVMSFGMSVSAPILAEIRDEFDLSFAVLGLILTMPPLARVVFTLPAGNLADQYSSRVLLSAGVATAAVGGLVSALAPAFAAVLVGALIVGAGSAVIFTAGMTGVARRASPRRRGRDMARLMAGFHLGALLSPALGGLVANALGWRAAFVLAAAIALVAVAGLWALVRTPEPARPSGDRPLARIPRPELTRDLMAIVALSLVLWGAAFGLKNVALPLYGSVALDLDPAGVGLVVSIAAAVRTASLFFAASLIDRVGRFAVLVPAATVGAVGSLLLLLEPSIAVYVLLGLLPALGGIASALPTILVADRVPPERLGRSLASVTFLTDIGLATMPPLVGFMLDSAGFWLVGIVFASTYAVAIVVGRRVIRGGRTDRPGLHADSAMADAPAIDPRSDPPPG